MKLCIIGSGLTGLSAAYALSDNHDIEILEKDEEAGGCLSSYHIHGYWIEKYYHHCFSENPVLFRLLRELGLLDRLVWLNGTTGYYTDGHLYALNTPFEILRYPEIGLADKARLAWLTIKVKKMDAELLDTITAEEFITQHVGRRTYTNFFEPLLRSKFGNQHSEVSAAWLVQRIKIRSNRGFSGERLGYLNGGFRILIDALIKNITGRGTTLRCNCPATHLEKRGDRWKVNGSCYDAVLSTIPPENLQKVGGPELPKIPYQGAACLTMGLDRDVTEGVYWLNMKDKAPYGAVITHTNFAPRTWYGEHIVYLASYFTETINPAFDQVMIDDFKRRFSVDDDEIHWRRFAVDPFAGPVYTTGFRSLIPDYGQSGLYLAGMFSPPNYPERSMEGSIISGYNLANLIEHKTS